MERYQKQYGLPEYDAQILTGSKRMADIFEQASERCKKPKKVSNWLMGETMRLLRENGQEPDTLSIDPYKLAKLVDLADFGAVNNTVAKEVFEELFLHDTDPEQYVKDHGLKTVNDEGKLRSVIEQVLKDYPKSVEDYRNGKQKAAGFLVGQTMKAMKGKANPGLVNQILKELL